jgi:hypothetical protein
MGLGGQRHALASLPSGKRPDTRCSGDVVGTTQSNFKQLFISPKLCNFVFLITRRLEIMFRHVLKIVKSDNWLRHIRPFVCLPVRLEQLGPHWKDFHEI